MSRACLTGALAGAQAGLSGIPERFICGLRDGEMLLSLSRQVALQAFEVLREEQSMFPLSSPLSNQVPARLRYLYVVMSLGGAGNR